MVTSEQYHHLAPWIFGVLVVAITDVITGFLFLTRNCAASGFAPSSAAILLAIVYVVVPVAYLALIYVALKRRR